MIKKGFLIFTLTLFTGAFSLQAQRFAYVDTEYIMEKMPEYKAAQKKLDEYVKEWREEIQKRIKEIDKLYKEYQAEKVLLPDKEVKKREQEIAKKEEELNKYKKDKFGKKGELYQKRKTLIKPIQDKVFNAVQKLAKEESLDFIFDKSGAVTMLYTNAKYDRSGKVLELLNVNVKEKEPSD